MATLLWPAEDKNAILVPSGDQPKGASITESPEVLGSVNGLTASRRAEKLEVAGIAARGAAVMQA